MIDTALDHLRILVAANSSNPPRAITRNHAAICHVHGVLEGAGFNVELCDLGDGCVNVLAVRGTPDLLFNCHLDTVPPDPAWVSDPFSLSVKSGRAIGLGACDIKGAAACLLTAAETTEGDAALLFTTDEEAGQNRCVRSFLEAHPDAFASVVVSEPTGCLCATEHRGLLSCEVEFAGRGGHSSTSAERVHSAIHDLARWADIALSDAELTKHRFNIGFVQGGEKPNMIASYARARFGLRPTPGTDPSEILSAMKNHIPSHAQAVLTTRFTGSPLAENPDATRIRARLGAKVGGLLDYWTEAAVFAQRGMPAVVFGPGEIAQAHTAGEFIELEQLSLATTLYSDVFTNVLEPTTQ